MVVGRLSIRCLRRTEPNNQAIVIEHYRMKGRMQKTTAEAVDRSRRNRTESEGYGGVQTYLWRLSHGLLFGVYCYVSECS